MSGQATTTANPQTSWGSNSIQNRVKPGGDLGSNQYYYTTESNTGKITVTRFERVKQGRGSFRNVETDIGNIPKGGSFTPNSDASSTEKSYYGNSTNLGKARSQALQVARREWDGKSQPSPNTSIYGNNAINAAYGATNSNGGTEDYTPPINFATGVTGWDKIGDAINTGNLGNIFGSKSPLGRSGTKAVLVYPTTLRQTGSNAQDYIQIDMMEYKPKKIGVEKNKISGFGSRNKNRKSLGTVILPIPGGISDSNAASWGSDSMNAAQAAAASIALAGVTEGMGEMGGEVEKSFKAATTGAGAADVKTALGAAIAGMASGTGSSLLTRTTGQIMNPNMELLFKDPSLRPFNFTWKLAPRSRDEARDVIKIIQHFKKGMAPIKSESNLFLKSPNTFRLAYKHRGKDHKFLNKFKECALVTFGTQYTPDGNYATFEDGVMTAYIITMSFQELEPIFSNDYGSNNEIGF